MIRCQTQGSANDRAKSPPDMYPGDPFALPDGDEVKIVETYFKSGNGRREAAVDLVWALINSAEFLYRH